MSVTQSTQQSHLPLSTRDVFVNSLHNLHVSVGFASIMRDLCRSGCCRFGLFNLMQMLFFSIVLYLRFKLAVEYPQKQTLTPLLCIVAMLNQRTTPLSIPLPLNESSWSKAWAPLHLHTIMLPNA